MGLESLESRVVLSVSGSGDERVADEVAVSTVRAALETESIVAQIVNVNPVGEVRGELLDDPPTLSPEQQAVIDANVQGILPEPIAGDGPVIVPETPQTIAAPPQFDPNLPGDVGSGGGGGTFEFYRLEAVDSVPNNRSSNVNEPSVGSTGRGVFQSGNWYASLSGDNGENWQNVDPYTMFAGEQWGGFCCDQRVAHDDVRGMTIWYLQYQPTGTTASDTNGVKLAVARSEENLLNNVWTVYDITPATFGLGPGVWFDFPHMQVTSDFVYVTTNIFSTVNDTYQENFIFRASLNELQAGGAISLPNWRPNQTWNDHGTIGLVTGATGTMYAASGVNSNTIRVFDVANASTSLQSRTVGGLNTTFFGTHTSLTPNGKNWTGRADSRMQTGWVSGNTVGFMWNSGQGTDRPQPFVRAVTFDANNLSSITSQPDLWSSDTAWHYPAIGVNARGHISGTVFVGGPNTYPRPQILISDDFTSPPAPWTNFGTVSGSDSGNSRWGDYLAAQSDDQFGNTWIATGFVQNGPGNTDTVPYFFWYGRERDNPGPNLRGIDFNVVQEPLNAGDSFNVEFMTINDGADAAAASRIDFYISDNDFISGLDELLGSTNIGGLAAGSDTGPLSTSLTLPPPNDPFWSGDGTYYIGMIADGGSVVSEYDEGDNANEGEFIDFDGLIISNTTGGTPTTIDLGFMGANSFTPPAESLAAGQVFFYQFELLEAVTAAEGDYFVIDTLGSTLTDAGTGPNDTEIGLYDAAGNRIDNNDDFDFTPAVDRESRLAYGADPLGFGLGDLAAGVYFLGLGAFNTVFNDTGFGVSSTSTSTGTITVNFENHLQPDTFNLGILPEGSSSGTGESLIPREVFFYEFELFEPIDAADGDYLVIDTLGSVLTDTGSGGNDTEIGLYDAAGNRIDNNDDFDFTPAIDRESRLAYGADPLGFGLGDLAAGSYFLAVGAFDSTFGATGFDASSTSAAVGSIVVNFEQEVNPSQIDLGVLPAGLIDPAAETLIPSEVFFYRFELADSIDAVDGDFLVIDTLGSSLTDAGSGVNDTEIGLYDAAGNLVASNDDFDFTAGVDRESRLAFGADPLVASSGDLPAGVYFLAVGAFNTSFGFVSFDASSVSNSVGTVDVNFELSIGPGFFAADFDKDRDVDGQDFLAWQAGFLTPSGASQADGDADGDGDVDGEDFLIWQSQFGLVGPGAGGGSDSGPPPVVVHSDSRHWLDKAASPILRTLSRLVREEGRRSESIRIAAATIDNVFGTEQPFHRWGGRIASELETTSGVEALHESSPHHAFRGASIR